MTEEQWCGMVGERNRLREDKAALEAKLREATGLLTEANRLIGAWQSKHRKAESHVLALRTKLEECYESEYDGRMDAITRCCDVLAEGKWKHAKTCILKSKLHHPKD